MVIMKIKNLLRNAKKSEPTFDECWLSRKLEPILLKGGILGQRHIHINCLKKYEDLLCIRTFYVFWGIPECETYKRTNICLIE